MQKVREILRLSELEMGERAIARAVKASRDTIKRYRAQFARAKLTHTEAAKLSDEELLAKITKPKPAPDRYRTLSEKFQGYVKELTRVGVTLCLLWKEYTAEQPGGYSYPQFCRHFRDWSGKTELSLHIEHKAGDKMYVDFTGKKMEIVSPLTGEITEVEVFVAVLGASGLTYAEATVSQKKQDWILANRNAFYYFGGVTHCIVPDNLKSAVTEADRFDPDVNLDYQDFAEHHGTVIMPARARKPKDKALAENGVKLIYQRVFAPLRNEVFHSLEELNQAIRDRLQEHNDAPMQITGVSRRELFEETEKAALLPLPVQRYQIKDFQGPTTIQKNYHVFLKEDKHYYSVPYRHRLSGGKATLLYTGKQVEIFKGGVRIASHVRDRRKGRYTTLREHMPPAHAAVSDWRPDEFLRKARRAGPHVEKLVAELLERARYPEQAYRSAMGLLSLGFKFGDLRLNRACRRALLFGEWRYKSVRNILQRGLDRLDEEQTDLSLPAHENIRGRDYYDYDNETEGEENDKRSDTGAIESNETPRHEYGISGHAGDGEHERHDVGRDAGGPDRCGMGVEAGKQVESPGKNGAIPLFGNTGRNQLSIQARSGQKQDHASGRLHLDPER